MINSWSLLYDELYGDDEMNTSNFTVGVSTESFGDNAYFIDPGNIENITIDTSNYDTFTSFGTGSTTVDVSGGYETLNISMPDEYPFGQNFLADNDDNAAHHFVMPTPSIEKNGSMKYEEDKSIQALRDYVSTTYGGHYTSDRNDVQTLDLIESVGDAEAFCRSNALKYLSRYDKKGQAKRDILKALHYTLLLYYFSGHTHETPIRGYETF